MTEILCTGCNQEIYPVKQPDLRGGGVKLSCPRCQCSLPASILDSAGPAKTRALTEPRIISIQARPVAGKPVPVETPADIAAPPDPEAMLRARLAWIEARLAEVEPLREEQAKLRRMLDAAAPPSAKRATG